MTTRQTEDTSKIAVLDKGVSQWALRSQFNNSIHHSMHLPILGIPLGAHGGHLANS